MPAELPITTGKVLITGRNVWVEAEYTKNTFRPLAFSTEFQANEDYQVQEATVLGFFGPISMDAQGYNCTLTFNGFVPSAETKEGLLTKYPFVDKSGQTEHCAPLDWKPYRGRFMEMDGLPYFETLRLMASVGGQKPLAVFRQVIITSFGLSVNGNEYMRNNVQARALSWDPPS